MTSLAQRPRAAGPGLRIVAAAPPSAAQLRWLREHLDPARSQRIELLATPNPCAGARAERAILHPLHLTLVAPGRRLSSCTAEGPTPLLLSEPNARPETLLVVLAERAAAPGEAARWALRRANGPALVIPREVAAPGRVRALIRDPEELAPVLDGLALAPPRLPVELLGCPRLDTQSAPVALRGLKEALAALSRARSQLAEGGREVRADVVLREPDRTGCSLLVRVRDDSLLRRWLAGEDEAALAQGGPAILRLPRPRRR